VKLSLIPDGTSSLKHKSQVYCDLICPRLRHHAYCTDDVA